jgi:hypothetical protein
MISPPQSDRTPQPRQPDNARLSMWTSTKTVHRTHLRATRVACALGHCRDATSCPTPRVFTAALDTVGNPTSLSAGRTTHVRDLT